MKKEKLIKDTEKEVEKIEDHLKILRKSMQDLRKNGKDPFIAQLVMRHAKAAKTMFQASPTENNYRKVTKLLKKIKAELEIVKKEENTSIEKEIENAVVQKEERAGRRYRRRKTRSKT